MCDCQETANWLYQGDDVPTLLGIWHHWILQFHYQGREPKRANWGGGIFTQGVCRDCFEHQWDGTTQWPAWRNQGPTCHAKESCDWIERVRSEAKEPREQLCGDNQAHPLKCDHTCLAQVASQFWLYLDSEAHTKSRRNPLHRLCNIQKPHPRTDTAWLQNPGIWGQAGAADQVREEAKR